MMSHGLISGSDARFYLYAKTIVSSRRWTGEACSCVFFNTQKARTIFFIENRGGSFRTKAAINDGFVTENSGMSFYELLGISESGTFSEIKQAYKQLARKYHPDVSPPDRIDEYTRRFIQIQEAYEVLSDPSSRALYDRDLAMGLHLAFSSRIGRER
ncbi:PREDICTED: chaperone protein dnaJ 20, chloroplastic-like isoform X2 [Nelumbo nucifera]|uniref:Chaperone protein dnaJ 20, chloroplastic-like isoform X2 n=1 Tax=Nelumbo nucifera TaxID=4432 RepID=A0A1U7ZF98_NELNU|nr:PREDICTED: chaperone protein dnaJ 20, chloroplastic-like isoform X2 [Nelumbo nucifera]